MTEYKNGTLWLDTDGNPIQAHGGHIIEYGGFYWWYGENRLGDNYVSCYRSRDLLNWEFRRNVLTKHSPCKEHRVKSDTSLVNEHGGKVNIERPKVAYNAKIGKFVMWAHYENGENYDAACACAAVSDAPDGEFTYLGSFRPFGEMSRDCTLFCDDDGKAYFVSSSRDNLDTHIYRLSDDYLNTSKLSAVLWQGEMREAPALFKKNGEYFMLNSYCTGWEPNQGKYSRSCGIEDGWQDLSLFGDETTFTSQPAFVLPVKRPDGGTDYYYFGDRWCYKGVNLRLEGNDTAEYYANSTYVVLKIRFDTDGNPYIEWSDTFKPDIKC